MRYLGALSLTALVFLLGCEGERKGLPAAAWLPYTSPDGQFTVLFPGYPRTAERDGFKVAHVQTLGPSVNFELKYAEVPASEAASPKQYFDTYEKSKLLKDIRKGELTDSRDIQLDGYPGREFMVRLAQSHGVMFRRLYLVKNRIYILDLSGPELPADTPYVQNFLDSFRIKSAPVDSKPPTTKAAPS